VGAPRGLSEAALKLTSQPVKFELRAQLRPAARRLGWMAATVSGYRGVRLWMAATT
jgi:hypothetical protein